jgi:hypothetical protein
MSVPRVKVQGTLRTSSIAGTLMIGSKIVTETGSVLSASASAVMRGTMISMAPTMTRPPDVVLRLEDIMMEKSRISVEI